MKYILSIIAALALAGTAFASQNGPNCNGNGSCATTTTNNITNAPVANGGQGGSVIGSGNSASISGASSKSDSKSSATVFSSNANVLGLKLNNGQQIAPVQALTLSTPKQAASPGSVNASGTTANCRIAGGLSFSGPFGGGSIAGSVLDETCEGIELAKANQYVGNTDEAKAIVGEMTAEWRAKRAKSKPAAGHAAAPLAVELSDPFTSFSN